MKLACGFGVWGAMDGGITVTSDDDTGQIRFSCAVFQVRAFHDDGSLTPIKGWTSHETLTSGHPICKCEVELSFKKFAMITSKFGFDNTYCVQMSNLQIEIFNSVRPATSYH